MGNQSIDESVTGVLSPAESSNSRNELLNETQSTTGLTRTISQTISTTSRVQYKVYKRRFFGLAQLILLNIIVSWDWITFAPVSKTAAQYFNTTESIINWLSTAFLFAFVVATPLTFWTLSKHGPKMAITITACLILVGNWVKYGGAKANNFGVVMLGQLIIGFAQPFVLSCPTTYSDVWFSPSGRTTATAVASLANPFGAALGQLITPFWVSTPKDIPNSVLWVAIISSVASIPAFFIPARPPTPPAANVDALLAAENPSVKSIKNELRVLLVSPEFYLLAIPFAIYVGFFNAFSSLLNQILEPYGFSEDDAGIAGAVLIVAGLVTAAIISPFNDKYKFYVVFIRIAVPVTALMYLIFIFAPPTSSIPYVYVVCAILGMASFGLVPIVLEFLVEILHPLGPSVSTSLCWSGGQLLGGIFIVVMDALKASQTANPPYNMHRALIFEAVIAMLTMPLPLCLGLFGRRGMIRLRRWEAEKSSSQEIDRDETGNAEQGLEH